MKIGLFVSAAGRRDSGPETYEHCLVREVARLDSENQYHIICFTQAAADSFQSLPGNFACHVLRPNSCWISIPASLPLALRRLDVDFYHATFIPPLVSFRPLLITMHGTDMFVHSEFFKPLTRLRLDTLMRRGLAQAGQIICVSRHVRDVIGARFNIPRERFAVVYHGVSEHFQPSPPEATRARLRERFGISRPYILYVGKMIASKNIARLLAAFRRARRETGGEIDLVMVGRTYRRMSDLEPEFWEAAAAGEIKVLGHVEHTELSWLYSGAMLFVFPSLWEGFGLPVLEAMACGCPVITSDLSCLPEVAGGAATLVDPYEVDAIASAIVTLCTDDVERTRLRALGLQRAAQFSWTETARRTIEVYRRIRV